MALFKDIVVAELPCLRSAVGGGPPPSPRFIVVLPDASKLPDNVLKFCFPDLESLAKRPFHYEQGVEEFAFTLTSRSEEYRMHGFVRRYRVGSPSTAGRLDLTPYTSSNLEEASSAPAYQCICILSERFVRGARGEAPRLCLVHTERGGRGCARKFRGHLVARSAELVSSDAAFTGRAAMHNSGSSY